MDGKCARVVVYGDNICPGTARTRAFLVARQLSYVFRDITQADAASEFGALGAWATPAIVLDGRLLMIGFDEQAFEEALTRQENGRAGGGGPGS